MAAEGKEDARPAALRPPGLLALGGKSPAPSSLEMSMSKHVGKEAGSQHFGFTGTRHPELEGPYWAAGPIPTPPRTGLLLTVAVWPM